MRRSQGKGEKNRARGGGDNGPKLPYTELMNFDSCPTRETLYSCTLFSDRHPLTVAMTIPVVVEMFNALNNLSENQSLLALMVGLSCIGAFIVYVCFLGCWRTFGDCTCLDYYAKFGLEMVAAIVFFVIINSPSSVATLAQESPRYLLMNSRNDEAIAVLGKMAEIN